MGAGASIPSSLLCEEHPWGGPWFHDCGHKQISSLLVLFMYRQEMLSQNLPASSAPLIGMFLVSEP